MSYKKDIYASCDEIEVELSPYHSVFLKNCDIADLIDEIGTNEVLDIIGEEKVRDYFGIEEEEN